MLNKIQVIGNLGKDPEVKVMTNGDKICNVSVATTETWKDKNTGEKKESVEWFHVVFYKNLADIVSKYLKKGSKVYIEGSMKTNKWIDKEGNARYTTNVIAKEMKMLDSAKSNEQNKGSHAQPNHAQQNQFQNTNTNHAQVQAQANQYPSSSFDTDIPF
jgi:single-strand DNA-binding protein